MTPLAPQRLAYILAPSHSGSTLLALLLASHPAVTTAGELNAAALDDPDRYLCSCGTAIRACGFWQRIAARMKDRGFTFDVTRAGTDYRGGSSPYVRRLLAPLHRGPALEWCRDRALDLSPRWHARLAEIQARNAALAGCIAAESGAQVIVDSSKIGVRLKYLLRNPALDVRVIRLVRDGRAVALTYVDPARFADASDPTLRGGGFGGTRDAERLTMEAAARQWRRSQEEAAAIVAQLPRDRWIEVRYEALCARPDEVLAGVFRMLGVDPSPPRQGFRAATRHVVGNGMRLDTTAEVRADDRWRVVLSDRDRRLFDAVAGPLNRRLGYAS